jgi:hypothetical protein
MNVREKERRREEMMTGKGRRRRHEREAKEGVRGKREEGI